MVPIVYAAFLYGVNVPKGKQLTLLRVQSDLEPLQPALAFAGIVGRPDSLLLWSTSPRTEDSVRRAVSEALDCPCVVISTETLERVVDSALDTLRALGSPTAPPYRVTLQGAEWEWCLVLASEPLPEDADRPAWLFNPTKTAVALRVLERRALLARKRRYTETGGRIMLGATLIDPWAYVLERNGVSVACLTSRTLNRVAEVVTAARALRR